MVKHQLKVFKKSSKSCFDTLQKLFNDALRDGYFPDKLKWADVTPVFEKYDPTKAKNYRPVSVLPGEVFERLMHKQISFYTDQFLSPNMCGHRSDFSTQRALIEKSLKVLDNKGYGGAIPMALSKALDTINHDLLIR